MTQLKADGLGAVGPSSARGAAALLGADWLSGELPLTSRVFARFPGRCRIEVSAPSGTRTLAAVWAQGRTRAEGGDFPALAAATEALCATLAL